jgi:hypothetical protein
MDSMEFSAQPVIVHMRQRKNMYARIDAQQREHIPVYSAARTPSQLCKHPCCWPDYGEAGIK